MNYTNKDSETCNFLGNTKQMLLNYHFQNNAWGFVYKGVLVKLMPDEYQISVYNTKKRPLTLSWDSETTYHQLYERVELSEIVPVYLSSSELMTLRNTNLVPAPNCRDDTPDAGTLVITACDLQTQECVDAACQINGSFSTDISNVNSVEIMSQLWTTVSRL